MPRQGRPQECFFLSFFRSCARLDLASSFSRVSFETVNALRNAMSSFSHGVPSGNFGAAAGFMASSF